MILAMINCFCATLFGTSIAAVLNDTIDQSQMNVSPAQKSGKAEQHLKVMRYLRHLRLLGVPHEQQSLAANNLPKRNIVNSGC